MLFFSHFWDADNRNFMFRHIRNTELMAMRLL